MEGIWTEDDKFSSQCLNANICKQCLCFRSSWSQKVRIPSFQAEAIWKFTIKCCIQHECKVPSWNSTNLFTPYCWKKMCTVHTFHVWIICLLFTTLWWKWDIYHIYWCRISAINPMSLKTSTPPRRIVTSNMRTSSPELAHKYLSTVDSRHLCIKRPKQRVSQEYCYSMCIFKCSSHITLLPFYSNDILMI